jgi:hypothetical protein
LGFLLAAAVSGSALGQYGTGGSTGSSSGGGYSAPKGGYKSSTGIAIGAGAAAGAGLAYYALRKHGRMVGCVEASSHGTNLINEKDKNTYALIASNGVVLAPGDRVALKGKRTKDDSGTLSFEVHKLVKDYGSCKQ